MAARGVTLLKFVGTVSLGVLTGLSYSLSTLTIPTLLTLPSASTASRAFDTLRTTAKVHVDALSIFSSSAFFLAYYLSPRAVRHPYLLYTAVAIVGTQLAHSEFLEPYLPFQVARPRGSPSAAAAAAAARRQAQLQKKQEQERAARARMEASYEVLGVEHSDHADAGSDVTEAEDDAFNGEEVRVKVEWFINRHIVQTVASGLGFAIAVIGIWGDGVVPVSVYSH